MEIVLTRTLQSGSQPNDTEQYIDGYVSKDCSFSYCEEILA